MANIRCDSKQCTKLDKNGFCTINSIIHINSYGVCTSYIKDIVKKQDIVNLVGDITDFKEIEIKEEELYFCSSSFIIHNMNILNIIF